VCEIEQKGNYRAEVGKLVYIRLREFAAYLLALEASALIDVLKVG